MFQINTVKFLVLLVYGILGVSISAQVEYLTLDITLSDRTFYISSDGETGNDSILIYDNGASVSYRDNDNRTHSLGISCSTTNPYGDERTVLWQSFTFLVDPFVGSYPDENVEIVFHDRSERWTLNNHDELSGGFSIMMDAPDTNRNSIVDFDLWTNMLTEILTRGEITVIYTVNDAEIKHVIEARPYPHKTHKMLDVLSHCMSSLQHFSEDNGGPNSASQALDEFLAQ